MRLLQKSKPSPKKKTITGDNYSESPEYHQEVEQSSKGGCYVANQILREDVVAPEAYPSDVIKEIEIPKFFLNQYKAACDGKLVNESGLRKSSRLYKLKVINSDGSTRNCENKEVGLMLNEMEGLYGPP
ncbi:hypothetical protein L6452_40695 [Arctium lappa]|uniref:Uncharacterized protein n=1 Tax=Arctium lappa TaxID=4217 RepID=A0ACB8XNT2_ARCLA|nr:hypothetical protein L6452_40695 [Arctium lappa]